MIRYIAGRLLQGLAVILAVATLTFALIHAAPGDPIAGRSENVHADAATLEQQRKDWGFDRPVLVQFGAYLSNLARGNLGVTVTGRRPVMDVIAEALPNTVLLALAALLIDFVLGIVLGVAQGSRLRSPFDHAAGAVTLALCSVPVFWVGILLQSVFAEHLRWLPATGVRDLLTYDGASPFHRVLDVLRHLVLPAVALGLVGAAGTARYQRARVFEVVRQDFVRTARAKGLRERVVLFRHALRNALLPTITLFGLSLPALLSGAVLVETVFAWPGIGLLSVNAIGQRDYFLVTGVAILGAAMVVMGSLVADILNLLADPRSRSS